MSNLKAVLERLAGRFSPPDGGLEQIARYRQRLRRRQRFYAATLAVAIATGGTGVAVWSFGREGLRAKQSPSGPEGHPTTHAGERYNAGLCGESPHDHYAPAVDPTSGPAGSSVSVSGVMFRMLGEDRQYIPTSRIQVWWNVDPELWTTVVLPTPSPARPGSSAGLLGEADVLTLCTYQFWVTIPAAVAPGTYPLILVFITPEGASTVSSVMEFQVT